MTMAYFDCFAGAGGDMIVGSLLDAGADLEAVRSHLLRLPVGEVRLSSEKVTRGGIRFENVRFGYGTERGVLKHIDLTIQPGERVGLVGQSGSGKSTLVNVLPFASDGGGNSARHCVRR